MNRLLLVILLTAACAVGLGFYLAWFHLGSNNDNGKSNVTLSVDTDKFQKDRQTATASVQNVERQIHDKVVGPSEKKTDAAVANSHDGHVVTIDGDKLVMTNTDSKTKHTHTLVAGIKITCDGRDCTVADLKPGMRIRVTTENQDPHGATRIEALENNRDFEKGV